MKEQPDGKTYSKTYSFINIMQETNLNITSLVTAVARLTGSQTDSTNANANPVAINKKRKTPLAANPSIQPTI